MNHTVQSSGCRFAHYKLKLELALPKKSIMLLRTSCFVAERRLNLARPFKAGIEEENQPRRVSDD